MTKSKSKLLGCWDGDSSPESFGEMLNLGFIWDGLPCVEHVERKRASGRTRSGRAAIAPSMCRESVQAGACAPAC